MSNTPPFKVIIAGGRKFDDYSLLKTMCDYYLKFKENIVVVSGRAQGADMMGETYAKERGYLIEACPAPWDSIEDKPESEIRVNGNGKKYWVRAGHYRNEEMAKIADCLIAFHDGKSVGTANMIKLAKKYNLQVRVVKY